MKKIIIIVVAVLVLAGGGAGGWWWWSQRAAAAAAAEEGNGGDDEEKAAEKGGDKAKSKSKKKKKASPEETGAIALEPFLVNLADKDASRFLRVSLQLVIDKKELAEEMGGKEAGEKFAVVKARLRSSILELLTTKTSEHLVTPEGKTELKTEIAEHATEVLEEEEAEVVDVLFTDFVVQF